MARKLRKRQAECPVYTWANSLGNNGKSQETARGKKSVACIAKKIHDTVNSGSGGMKKGLRRILTNFYLRGIIVSFLIVPVLPAISHGSDGPGTTGALYLTLPVSTRSISMGETGSAIKGDPFGWLINPAMLGESSEMGFGLFHSQWILDTAYDNAFFTRNFARIFSAGISLTYMSCPDVPGFDSMGYPTSALKSNSFEGVLGLSVAPVDNLRVGANIKFFQERLADWTAGGAGADFGAIVRLPLPDISIGGSVQNIGPNIKFTTHEEELPMTLRFGGSYGKTLVPGIAKLRFAADLVKPKHQETYPTFGAELTLRDIFSIRAGYCGEKEREYSGLAAGGGFRILGRIAFDYAWTPYGDLGNFHRVSVHFSR